MIESWASWDVDAADLVAWLYVYVLPAVVAAVVLSASWRGRHAPMDSVRDRARTVRLLGLCQYGLAWRALLMVVPEWITYRATGGFASLAVLNVFWPLATAALLFPLGLGLRRLEPWARWGAVGLNGFLALVAALVAGWMIAYGAAVYAWDWPEVAAGRILPFFVLVVLLAPGTNAVFGAEPKAQSLPAPAAVRPSVFSLVALGFLVVLGAVVAVNAADWGIRYVVLPALVRS